MFFKLKTKNEIQKIKEGVEQIDVNMIRPNPYQTRTNIKKIPLEDLSESIRDYGILNPISVRKISDNTYEVVAGERRLMASKMCGHEKIPAIILNANERDLAIMTLVENVQREELNFLEEAQGYLDIIEKQGLTQDQLAKKIGKSQSTIANKIRLLRLPDEIKKILLENCLTERHARALLRLHDKKLQFKILEYVSRKSLNVKRTEDLIERAIERYSLNEKNERLGSFTRSIKDVRIFTNTINQAINAMRESGVKAKTAKRDKGKYMEYVVRIPKGAC